MVTCQYYPRGNNNNEYASNVGLLKCARPVVENGDITPESDTVEEGQQYVVRCKEGFNLQGEVDTLTCGSDGRFTSASVTCSPAEQRVTCSRPTVEHALITPDTDTVEEGEKYTITCVNFEGDKLSGHVDTFTCGSDGKLTPASITCAKTSGEGKTALSAVLMLMVAVVRMFN
jgi:hypothetical protein